MSSRKCTTSTRKQSVIDSTKHSLNKVHDSNKHESEVSPQSSMDRKFHRVVITRKSARGIQKDQTNQGIEVEVQRDANSKEKKSKKETKIELEKRFLNVDQDTDLDTSPIPSSGPRKQVKLDKPSTKTTSSKADKQAKKGKSDKKGKENEKNLKEDDGKMSDEAEESTANRKKVRRSSTRRKDQTKPYPKSEVKATSNQNTFKSGSTKFEFESNLKDSFQYQDSSCLNQEPKQQAFSLGKNDQCPSTSLLPSEILNDFVKLDKNDLKQSDQISPDSDSLTACSENIGELEVHKVAIGPGYQSQIPSYELNSKSKSKTKGRTLKLIWDPEAAGNKNISAYCLKIGGIIGQAITNEEKVIQSLVKFDMNFEALLESIEKTKGYYKNHFSVGQRVLRNRKTL